MLDGRLERGARLSAPALGGQHVAQGEVGDADRRGAVALADALDGDGQRPLGVLAGRPELPEVRAKHRASPQHRRLVPTAGRLVDGRHLVDERPGVGPVAAFLSQPRPIDAHRHEGGMRRREHRLEAGLDVVQQALAELQLAARHVVAGADEHCLIGHDGVAGADGLLVGACGQRDRLVHATVVEHGLGEVVPQHGVDAGGLGAFGADRDRAPEHQFGLARPAERVEHQAPVVEQRAGALGIVAAHGHEPACASANASLASRNRPALRSDSASSIPMRDSIKRRQGARPGGNGLGGPARDRRRVPARRSSCAPHRARWQAMRASRTAGRRAAAQPFVQEPPGA